MQQRDLCRKERVLPDEGFGAVDRIYEPEIFGILLCFAGLFTEKTMLRKATED